MDLEKFFKKMIEEFYKQNRKHIWLALRVVFLMFFTILIGVNAYYFEDYLILMVIVITIGIIIFFIPLQKLRSFLSIDSEDEKKS